MGWFNTATIIRQWSISFYPCGLLIAYIDGLVEDCSNSRVLAMELLQSCTKPSIWCQYVNALAPQECGVILKV